MNEEIKKAPLNEYGNELQTTTNIRNVGWTLGNDCPYKCKHCYSMSAREKGMNLSEEIVTRVIEQLKSLNVETINLGGNEPIFTNGLDFKKSLLPYVIKKVTDEKMDVGITTSGITIKILEKHFSETIDLINDVDVSLDSPRKEEHDNNRGAKTYDQAIEAIKICKKRNIPVTLVMAAMNWNFTPDHIDELVALCKELGVNVRINPLKVVDKKHSHLQMSPEMYFKGFERLIGLCKSVDIGETPIAALTGSEKCKRCPCGVSSFRINSITPDGKIFLSPCVYMHDYKCHLDLMNHDVKEIINSQEFKVFRQRNSNPELIKGCANCSHLEVCGGGCAARAYLHEKFTNGNQTMMAKDPFCLLDYKKEDFSPVKAEKTKENKRLVHVDYLCTWIGTPV